jgi:hypothetical protein
MRSGEPFGTRLGRNSNESDSPIRFAVATVMFVTTGLVASQMYYVKGWHFVVSLSFFLVAGFLDGYFPSRLHSC